MVEERPLSSEEMIRQARKDLSQASKFPMPGAEEAAADLDIAESDDPKPLPSAATPKPRRAHKRKRPLPPDPFFESQRPPRQQAKSQAAAVFVALVVAIAGIAILFALAASNAP